MKHSQFSIFLCAVTLVAVAILSPLLSSAQSNRRTISVVGSASEGSTQISSEGRGLTLRVTSHDATAVMAFAKLSDQIRSLRKELQDAGADAGEIHESDVQVSPNYDYSKAGLPPSITGYQVAKSITVQVEREADLPKLIDAATLAGVSSVALGTGEADDPAKDGDDAKLEQDALKDAHAKAEQLAKEMGANLGDIVSVGALEEPKSNGGGEEEREREEHKQFSAPKTKTLELKVVYSIR